MPLFFADPSELYAIADRISRHADSVRSSATALAAAVTNDHWRGIASDVFSAEARSVLSDMWACAGRLDNAADALRRHARRVEAVLGALRQFWREGKNFSGDLLEIDADVFTDPGDVFGDVGNLLADAGGLVHDGLSLIGLG